MFISRKEFEQRKAEQNKKISDLQDEVFVLKNRFRKIETYEYYSSDDKDGVQAYSRSAICAMFGVGGDFEEIPIRDLLSLIIKKMNVEIKEEPEKPKSLKLVKKPKS